MPALSFGGAYTQLGLDRLAALATAAEAAHNINMRTSHHLVHSTLKWRLRRRLQRIDRQMNDGSAMGHGGDN